MGLNTERPRPKPPEAEQSVSIAAVEQVSLALCPREMLVRYKFMQRRFKRRANGKVLLFPVWRTQRQAASEIVTIRHHFPWLKQLPLGVSRFMARLLLK